MSYEIFEKKAALNSEFEVIPTKIQLYAEGVGFDANGYMRYDGLTYPTDTVKLSSLPLKIRGLFAPQKYDVVTPGTRDIDTTGGKTSPLQIDGNLTNLSKILMEQLENITNPEKIKDVDITAELKKANAVCNVADKIINVVDLSLRVEIFQDKKLCR